MKTNLDYPSHDAMVTLLQESFKRDRSREVQPVIAAESLEKLSRLADHVMVRDELLGYVARIAEASRAHKHVKLGVSARGCLAYVRCAKTWAIAHGRTYVTVDDIRLLAKPILSHRIQVNSEALFDDVTVDQVLKEILYEVQPPMERAA